ncbi:MAG TPA: FAD-dependent oxidoreductase [Bryobacteraceae bacterium]|nr:FAD-dependent oxidoreductase [Bryobacteraceae bacterium]
MRFARREFLGMTSALLAGCAAGRMRVGPPVARALLARVNVKAERVIRTTVGLRPFRPSGFVVRAEKLDDKLVVHNYGHGGAGITLSWGTAQLAVNEAARVEKRDCAVIGCGVVGLSTARLLQERGYAVTIYAKALPPDTTSNLAGGYWDPVTVYDHERVTPEFRRQFGEAGRFAFRRYQSMVGERFAVRWLPVYSLSDDAAHRMPPPDSPYSAIEPLYPEARQLTRDEIPFDVEYAYRRDSMLIEPAIYLQAMLDEFFIAGGRVVVREFRAALELMSLKDTLIFNCTGLGARALFGDDELVPVRGQLEFLLPQPEIDYMTVGPGDIYMFPRRDGILLGGSHERGNWSLEPDPETSKRILRENAGLFSGMLNVKA